MVCETERINFLYGVEEVEQKSRTDTYLERAEDLSGDKIKVLLQYLFKRDINCSWLHGAVYFRDAVICQWFPPKLQLRPRNCQKLFNVIKNPFRCHLRVDK